MFKGQLTSRFNVEEKILQKKKKIKGRKKERNEGTKIEEKN